MKKRISNTLLRFAGVRALVDRPVLANALGLKDHQVILLAQCVGRPAP